MGKPDGRVSGMRMSQSFRSSNFLLSCDESWDQMVPPQVAEIIRRRGFFGYKKR
jgi:hypothetical protein